MKQLITNLFCIIGKPGTRKQAMINYIFSDSSFTDKYSFRRFVCGTTRDIRQTDVEGNFYHFYTEREFKDLKNNDIIECRHYDNFKTKKLDRYFTLTSHILPGVNYVGTTTLFQYEEIKKWATLKQMANPKLQINIFPIYIKAPLYTRIKQLLLEDPYKTDSSIYEICMRVVSEKFEYRDVNENLIIDHSNPNTCIIKTDDITENLETVVNTIVQFIEKHLKGEDT